MDSDQNNPRSGIVLIDYQSLMAYIDQLPSTRPMKAKRDAAKSQKVTTPRRRRKQKETAMA